jgi:hypothetical protein
VAGRLLLYKLVGIIEVLALVLLIALILDPAMNLIVRLRLPRFWRCLWSWSAWSWGLTF